MKRWIPADRKVNLNDPLAGIWPRGEWFLRPLSTSRGYFYPSLYRQFFWKTQAQLQSSLGHGPGKTERNQSRIMLSCTEVGVKENGGQVR